MRLVYCSTQFAECLFFMIYVLYPLHRAAVRLAGPFPVFVGPVAGPVSEGPSHYSNNSLFLSPACHWRPLTPGETRPPQAESC